MALARRLAEDMVAKLTALGIGVAPVTLGNRVAFAETLAGGYGVTEVEPHSVAAQEIAALGEAIWSRAG